ncbi:UNVERIFIED_CONTAM: putative ribonuclease H protein [Sesamum latifolium]|uniref:Ribonuclease H protein n=1 Tax=Sesamum latifolium TaxID=2727402 RepID=A0AAW2VWM1_9LAMI
MVEAFSGLIRKAESEGVIQGVAVSQSAPPVSHLLFADDNLIFCQASEEVVSHLQMVLVDFKVASGLKINKHKSAMVFSEMWRRRLDLHWRLKEFNLALLAKQAWRVALGPRSVLNSVLSHKYFPHSSFFDSKLGSSPSYTWKSLWGNHDVLAAGLHWKVGDDTLIMIMEHPWNPKLVSFQPISRPAFTPQDSRVAALLTDAKAWDAELIKAELCPLDAESILDIKLHDGECDSLVWHFEKQGQFSVRSTYDVALRLELDAECSMNAQSWDFIWCSKAPPKVILIA